MKNAKTGTRAGSLAAAILASSKDLVGTSQVIAVVDGNVWLGLMTFLRSIGKGDDVISYIGTLDEIQTVAASALAQRSEKEKKSSTS